MSTQMELKLPLYCHNILVNSIDMIMFREELVIQFICFDIVFIAALLTLMVCVCFCVYRQWAVTRF